MIIDFSFSNFRSFRDLQRVSFNAAPLRSNEIGMGEDKVFIHEEFRLLKTKAVYGANGSGKSNLAKAFSAFVFMVSKSVQEENLTNYVWNDRFQLITNWDEQPVMFQMTFFVGKVIYRYGFQISKSKIAQEWLYRRVGKKDIQLFLRSGLHLKKLDTVNFQGAKLFSKQLKSEDSELFRDDSLFLTAAALNGNKLAKTIRDSIVSIMTVDGVNDKDAILFAIRRLEKNKDQKEVLEKFLNATDTGVEGLTILEFKDPTSKKNQLPNISKEDLEDNSRILKGLFSLHSIYDDKGKFIKKEPFGFGKWESEGTSKLLSIGALILEALSTGRSIVIDEFDARLHPNITLKLLELFHSSRTNPKNAQLIFITHDSGLLERANLRRDQICIVEKDRFGLSNSTTLIEYKGVRKDASYEKEYLNGKYKGIPFLENLETIANPKAKKN